MEDSSSPAPKRQRTEEPLNEASSNDRNGTDPQQTQRKYKRKKPGMRGDLEEMMFGFGDQWPPNNQTVAIVEQLVHRYVKSLAYRAMEVADLTGKMDKSCFMFVVRKDRAKFERARQLLKANEELKAAQKLDIVPPTEEDDEPTAIPQQHQ